ncbi:hypothetical protein [Nonomuraea dietziae]|uniref:hypothetical protein n=1 Tax=Nonomuraea dietziae TaxID=65515 RepID=UPI0031CFCCDE
MVLALDELWRALRAPGMVAAMDGITSSSIQGRNLSDDYPLAAGPRGAADRGGRAKARGLMEALRHLILARHAGE